MKILRKTLILLCLTMVTFFCSSCRKDKIDSIHVEDFSIHSASTGSDYAVWVALPRDYNPDLNYETVYLLDAQTSYLHYDKIAKIAEAQSLAYSKQNVIVVGISSENDRERDFTPTITSMGGGGSESYSNFIEFELIPKIESAYPVDTTAKSRAVIGHSYGGLMVCYFFVKHAGIFGNYLILSPSLWYDNGILLQYESDFRTQNSAQANLVFIACGELEESIVLGTQELDYRLSAYYPNCIHYYHKAINRAHLESAFPNVEKGLEFYFKNK